MDRTDWLEIIDDIGPSFAEGAAERDENDEVIAAHYPVLKERAVSSAMVPGELGGGGGSEAAVGHAASGPLALANWCSVKCGVYFAAMFGGVGLTLDKLTDMTPFSVLVYALIGGFIIGQGAHQFLRLIRKTSGNSQVSVRDFINRTGRVTIRVQPPKRGEVAVHIGDRERFVPAVSRRPDDEFKVGDKVVIVGFNAGTAEVISKREHEFTTDAQPGGDV